MTLHTAAGIKEKEKLEASRPAFGESSAGDGQEDMAQATVTPLVLSETLHSPQYSEVRNEVAGDKFFGAYLDYEQRLRIANEEGGVSYTQVPIGQLIPAYVRQCFELIHTDGRPTNAAELLNAVKQHAGYTTTGDRENKASAAPDIKRILRMATSNALGIDFYPLALEKLRPRAVPVKTGVKTSSFLPARRVTVPPWSFQTERVEQAPADVVVEPLLVDRGIERFMYPAEERHARESTRKESVPQAVQSCDENG